MTHAPDQPERPNPTYTRSLNEFCWMGLGWDCRISEPHPERKADRVLWRP